jgi:hypothetical protein
MRLQFNYAANLSDTVCDVHTHCASVELFLRGIHTVQLDHCTLEFEHASELTYAQLMLANSSVYTVSAV